MIRIKKIALSLIGALIIMQCGCTRKEKSNYEGYYAVGWADDHEIIAIYRKSIIEKAGSDSNSKEAIQTIVRIDPVNNEETIITEIPWGEGPGYLFDVEGREIGYFGSSSKARAYVIWSRNNLGIETERIIQEIVNFKNSPLWNRQRTYFVMNLADQFWIYNAELEKIQVKLQTSHSVWKSETELFFYDQVSDRVGIYNIITQGVQLLTKSFKPDHYSQQENRLSRIEGGVLYQYDLDTDEIASKNLNYNSGQLRRYYFSPDGKRVILSRFGGFYQPDKTLPLDQSNGIYLYNLETDELTKVRE
jgi:hypothetical protein